MQMRMGMGQFGPSISVAPTTTTVSSSFSTPAILLIGVFGISLVATIAGSGAVRTLGVLGMLGSAGLYLSSALTD